MEKNLIQKAAQPKSDLAEKSKPSINTLMSHVLDSEGMRRRFDELLGKRAPQFISSIVSLVNADQALQRAMVEAPMTVVQAALKAATFDLPIDPNLGYAYIVGFKNCKKQQDGTKKYVNEASFIMGYKGMHQLAVRTGVYKTINVVDVREGELFSYDRLRETIELNFIDDEDERESRKVIGYVGFYRLMNGTEKTIYMTVKQIENHEKKRRNGDYMGKGWRDDWDAMARKTVYRRLIGRWGVMSIDYRIANHPQDLALASALASGQITDDDFSGDVPEAIVINEDGEILEDKANE